MSRWEVELTRISGQENVISELHRDELIRQLDHADESYPGGLSGYITRSRELLEASRKNINPYAGFKVTTPPTVSLNIGDDQFLMYERIGLQSAAKLGFVLVAGGLGERLGYPDIKINLPVDLITEMTYCGYYFATIAACQALNPGKKLPVMIMTSDDTHDRTVNLLEECKYYGLSKDQVYILKQAKVPAVLDNNATLGIDPKTGDLITKPHGHGDVHTLIYKHKLMEMWSAEFGTEYIFFFQDTNALSFRSLFAMLGVTIKHEYHMNSLAVLRTPGEAVGAICTLDNGTTRYTVNVEYNLLDSLLPEGDQPISAENPYSALPGNCNILMFYVPPYNEALQKTKGLVPEFVNPKYKDSITKTQFKSPTRLEGMMQDFAKCMPDADRIVATTMDRWFCFSCVKNNITDAAIKFSAGIPPESASSAEAAFYINNLKCLAMALPKKSEFVVVKPDDEASFPEYLNGEAYVDEQRIQAQYQGTTVPMNIPKIIMSPAFAICLTQMIDRLKEVESIEISQLAVLVLNCNVNFKSIGIYNDSALVLPQEYSPNSQLTISGKFTLSNGVKYKFDPDVLPSDRLVNQIRGYKVIRL